MSRRIHISGSVCNMIGGLIGVLGCLLRFARLMLLTLHREWDENRRYAGQASLTIVKQRNDPCGSIGLAFDEEHLRFQPLEHATEQDQQGA